MPTVERCRARAGNFEDVADWLNSGWSAVLGYGAIVVLALTLGRLEQRGAVAGSRVGSWPAFWFTTALLALAMGVGRALHAGGRAAELGRRQAVAGGWYEERRGLQVVVIAALAVLAAVTMWICIRRWGPRLRDGYSTVGVLMSALVCYSVVSVVSLHQIDSVIWGNEAGGVTFGSLIELALLAAVIAVTLVRLAERWRPKTRAEDMPRGSHCPQG